MTVALDDAPNVGVACVGCKSLGHWCQATRYIDYGAGDVPVCGPCVAEQECSVVLTQRVDETVLLARFDAPHSAVRSLPVPARKVVVEAKSEWRQGLERGKAQERVARPAGQEPLQLQLLPKPKPKLLPAPVPVPVKDVVQQIEEDDMPRGLVSKLSPAVIEKIKDAPENMPTAVLAKRLGISEKACYYQRRKYRKLAASAVAGTVAAIEPKAAKAATQGRIATVKHIEAATVVMVEAAPALATVPGTPRTADVSFTVTEETLDAWWGDLDVKTKADLLSARMSFLLERGEAAG